MLNKIKKCIFEKLCKDYIDTKFLELEKQILVYNKEYKQAVVQCDDSVRYCHTIKNNIAGILKYFDISLDMTANNKYSKNWCVISIQGKKMDYVQFIDDLSDKDIRSIASFLRQFKNYKVDCPVGMKELFRIERNNDTL